MWDANHNVHASQEQNELRQDQFRAGLRHATPQPNKHSGEMIYYVLSHWPGQAPTSWRRMLYAALAHGTRIVDLYEFHSSFHTTEVKWRCFLHLSGFPSR